jgi:hypothetical protein
MWVAYWWMKWHSLTNNQVEPIENSLKILKRDTRLHILVMKHAKGRNFHAGINTTITNVYKIILVHNQGNVAILGRFFKLLLNLWKSRETFKNTSIILSD